LVPQIVKLRPADAEETDANDRNARQNRKRKSAYSEEQWKEWAMKKMKDEEESAEPEPDGEQDVESKGGNDEKWTTQKWTLEEWIEYGKRKENADKQTEAPNGKQFVACDFAFVYNLPPSPRVLAR